MAIFVIENREFGWDEIVLAAQTWGEWHPFVETTRQSLSCLRLAKKTGQLPNASEAREAATVFRYAHNLISGEEARSWLASWEMTVDEWMNYFNCLLLQERWASRLKEIEVSNPVNDQEVSEVIRCHAVCSNKLHDWAVKLAGRAAVAAKSRSFDAIPDLRTGSSANLVSRIETEFQRQRQQTLTAKLIATKIADRRLDWIRFDSRYVWFGEEGIAREAAMCVTKDGLTLEEVACDAHGIVQKWNFYLDEIEAPARPHFLAARKGDWVGPVRMIEGFPIFSIVAKTMPSAEDSEIRDRAEHAIVAGLMEQAMNERVKWARL